MHQSASNYLDELLTKMKNQMVTGGRMGSLDAKILNAVIFLFEEKKLLEVCQKKFWITS